MLIINAPTLTSLEVAEMVGKDHKNIMRDIRGYLEVMEVGSNLSASQFFIEGTYVDSLNRNKPMYHLSRKGCEMVANKMTGEKGVLFTATYINRFHELEQQAGPKLPSTYKEALLALVEAEEKKELLLLENAQNKQIINELQPKATYYDLVLQNKSLLAVSKISKDYGLSAKALNKHLHELGIQFKQGDCWLLYQKYADKGYTQSKTQVIDDTKSKLHTYWTQKGRLFIYETLKNKLGLLPLIERE